MRYIIILLLPLTMLACSPQNTNEVIIKGQLNNFTGRNIVFHYGGQTDTIGVEADGHFSEKLNLNKNEMVSFQAEKLVGRLYLIPGYNLEFEQDANNLDQGIKFLNDNVCVAVNNYFKDKVKFQNELKVNRKDYFSMEEADFIAKTERDFKKIEELLEELIQKNGKIPGAFIIDEKAALKYEELVNYLYYESSHGRYTKNYEFKAGKAIMKKLAMEEFNRSDLLHVSEYKNYIKRKLQKLGYQFYNEEPKYKEMEDGYYIAMFNKMVQLVSAPEIRSFLAANIAEGRVGWSIAEDSPVLKEFKKYCTDEKALQRINEKVAHWTRLSQGRAAFDFTGETVDGKALSLSDLKGKYVYVDVWATWCGPCRREIPYLEKLEREYHGRDITFLSVSIDDDMDKWKKMVTAKNMGGIQINVGHRTNISKDYMINGIPRFMLFDPQGKIVDVNAPRPSGKIRDVLKKLKNL